jgi:uncharacterized protein DUF2188
VKKGKAGRASANTQAAADRRARQIVGNRGGGEVVIKDEGGRIRDRDTVAPAGGPEPTEGPSPQARDHPRTHPQVGFSTFPPGAVIQCAFEPSASTTQTCPFDTNVI